MRFPLCHKQDSVLHSLESSNSLPRTHIPRLQQRIEEHPWIRQRGLRQCVFALHIACVRRRRRTQVWHVRVVPAPVRASVREADSRGIGRRHRRTNTGTSTGASSRRPGRCRNNTWLRIGTRNSRSRLRPGCRCRSCRACGRRVVRANIGCRRMRKRVVQKRNDAVVELLNNIKVLRELADKCKTLRKLRIAASLRQR